MTPDGDLVTLNRDSHARARAVSIGEAALTMAIGIVVERVSRLPSEDQKELYELVKGIAGQKDAEEVDAICRAMLEILDQEPSGLKVLDPAQPQNRPDKLEKWVSFIADRVQTLRKAAKMTQVELAERAGLPQSHISRIEKAKLSPSRATLEKITNALNVKLCDLDPSA